MLLIKVLWYASRVKNMHFGAPLESCDWCGKPKLSYVKYIISRGVVRNINLWVPKFAQYEFDPIDLSFIAMGTSFPQNPWVLFYTFQKSVGSVESTEPKLTTPSPESRIFEGGYYARNILLENRFFFSFDWLMYPVYGYNSKSRLKFNGLIFQAFLRD